MKRRRSELLSSREASNVQNNASLAGRELPGDTVDQLTNMTMGQLFYLLGHIQKLSAQAPVTAQALLAENPQICYSLLHAECLAGMVDKPLLPMSAEELNKAKSRARQIQEEIDSSELPPPAADSPAFAKSAGAAPSFLGQVKMEAGRAHGLAVKTEAHLPPAGPAFAKSSSLQPPPPAPPMAGLIPGLAGGPQDEGQKQALMHKLMQLTPDQIAKLPEDTKMQVLRFLQQNQQ